MTFSALYDIINIVYSKEVIPLQITHMNATFGKLQRAELHLQPGLNVIYAPNESGKSTWTAFIRAMLYGLSTRERGTLADKNRYAPWNGSTMQGRMDVADGAQRYTVTRNTARIGSPMGDFSCTYSDTSTPVPGITGQNLGETLLGVPREVFERSALIRQSALTVEQDAELERRIAALITTGEEDTSYTEVHERLKKQLNRRKHNKTGLIPNLENEIDALDDALAELATLTAKSDATQAHLDTLSEQLQNLNSQNEQWEQLEKQDALQKYRAAQQSAIEAQQRADLLSQLAGDLPDHATLTQLEVQSAALTSSQARLSHAKQNYDAAQAAEHRASVAYQQHPLCPADATALAQRQSAMVTPMLPGKAWWLCTALTGAAVIAFVLMLLSVLPFALWQAVITGILACAGLGGTLYYVLRKRKILRQIDDITKKKEILAAQIAKYLPLQKAAQEADVQLSHAQSVYNELSQQHQQDMVLLLAQIHRFQPSVNDLPSVQIAIADARHKQQTLMQAKKDAQEAALRCQIMAEHLPAKPHPDSDVPLSQPTLTREEINLQLRQLMSDMQTARTQLDSLQGQIRGLGDPTHIAQRRQIKCEQLSQLQAEYSALQMAMESLDNANLTLQNRFSPALGAKTAEIFSAITDGRYHKVLLNRDFSLSAETVNNPIGRSIQLLSQGTADQLYLAVRLAICDMVLPEEKSVPLILDDALLSFDEQRLHAALDYLLAESKHRQIILFSCQKREQAYLADCDGVTCLSL